MAMLGEANKRKKFLFVDDDTGFLAGIREVFSKMARGSWENLWRKTTPRRWRSCNSNEWMS